MIKIRRNRLEISKERYNYMITDKKGDLFIHADTLTFGQSNVERTKAWLLFYNKDRTYIGSVWIDTDTDMKKVEKFLEEIK